MGNGLTLGQVEVVVSFYAPAVGVRGHGVPNGSRVQLGEPELQLAGTFFKHVVHNQLIHRAVVGLFGGAHGSPYGCLERAFPSVECNPLCFIVLVGSGRVQIELGRLGSILGTELHVFVHILARGNMSATDVEGLLGREGIFLAVNHHHTVALTAVNNAEFAVIEEILLLDVGVYIESQLKKVLELQSLGYGHGTAIDEAVVVTVGEVNLIGLHHLFHHETVAQGLRVIVLHVLRVAGCLELHILLGLNAQRAHQKGKTKNCFFHWFIVFLFVIFVRNVIIVKNVRNVIIVRNVMNVMNVISL